MWELEDFIDLNLKPAFMSRIRLITGLDGRTTCGDICHSSAWETRIL